MLESNNFLSKKNGDAIIAQIAEKIGVDSAAAKGIYDKAMDIIGGGLIDKLKHPFG